MKHEANDTETLIGMCSVKVHGGGPRHCGKPMKLAKMSEHFTCECGASVALSQMVYTNVSMMKRDEVAHG